MPRQDVRQIMFEGKDSNLVYNQTVNMLRNKYYALYRSNFKWTGINYRQEDFIMRKFWSEGTVCAFNIPVADELGFCSWARNTIDMYGETETVTLVNQYGSPLIPNTIQTVDKDVVIGWIQSNRKPMKMIVDWYIERIAQVDMVINTNLNLHKMPYLIPLDKSDKDAKNQVKDAIDRILNNELVLFVEGVDPTLFKAVATEAPYIIDKLANYRKDLENDLKTYMGVNNPGVTKIEQLQLSEVNANNEEVNSHDNDFKECLNQFCERIQEVLGKSISVETVREPAVEDGVEKTYEEAPGPKGDVIEDEN